MWIRRALLITLVASLNNNLAPAQELKVDVVAVKALVSKWNDMHNSGEVETLESLYSDNVKFYGSTLPRKKCISMKRDALQKFDEFNQVLKNDLFLSAYSTGIIRCDFVKTVSRNNTTTDYKAYLLLKQIGENYLIVGESDLITDRNLKNEPDLGGRVAIKDVRKIVSSEVSLPIDGVVDTSSSSLNDIILLSGSLILGAIGLVLAYRRWLKPLAAKSPEPVDNTAQVADYFEMGLKFEKFIVEQFNIYRDYFTLQEWRSDKFHNGIFPRSNQDPDLVYEYKYKDFARTFSVECKYRSKAFGLVRIMDDSNYKNYQAFHLKIPVYIALGLGGEPNNPDELFLIPFQNVKLEMSYRELLKYRKARKFFYDMDLDRLT